MDQKRIDTEALLEGGIFLLGISLLTGLAIYAGGQISAMVKHQQRRSAPAPEPGSVPKSRHENIGAVSSR
jgi:hypothetical protein